MFVGACTGSSEPDSGPASSVGSGTTAPVRSGAEASTTLAGSVATSGELEALTPAMFDQISNCVLTPTSTAGPFPTINRMNRRVIHDGVPGHPLRLGLSVVDRTCQAVSGAVVDLWHTDATGDYSEFTDGGSGKDEGEGSTFCRGFQISDADGIVEFETVYPGWYDGWAVHLHVMVLVDDENVLTGQLYFDESYTEEVHRTGAYAPFGPPDTGWDDDRIIGTPATDGTGLVLAAAATGLGPGTLGLANLGFP